MKKINGFLGFSLMEKRLVKNGECERHSYGKMVDKRRSSEEKQSMKMEKFGMIKMYRL